jgi:hypothetical protein
MTERLVSDLHPDWVCKNPNCTRVITDPREGPWLDLSEPGYRDIVLQRLLELAQMGVDGLYFDFRHLPKEGCWCSPLASAFDETGTSPPTDKDLNDPVYRQFLDFKAYKIEEAFAYWKQMVKSQFPHVVFVVSATGIPIPHSRYETTNLVRLADSVKNEYKHALALENVDTFFRENNLAEPARDIRQAFGWVLMRDSADGRPPHIWERAFQDHEHARAATAAMLTYGLVANTNVDERILADRSPLETSTPLEGLKAAFDLGNQVSPHLAHSRPLHWAAVHFSELTRNRRGGDLRLAWQEILWPALGAFGVFVRAGLPVGIVNDYQLEHNLLAGYQVLFLPTPNELSGVQKKSIRQFVNRGGILLKNSQGVLWSNPLTNAAAEGAFRAEIQPVITCMPPPVHVIGGINKIHAVAFEDKKGRRLLVAVTNDYSWVRWVPPPVDDPDDEPNDADSGGLPPVDTPRPPLVSAVDVLVRNRRPPRRIFEALSGTPLSRQVIPHGYKVRLPDFQTMALLVVHE